MPRGIAISWSSNLYRQGLDTGIRVRIEVVGAVGLSRKVFAYRALPRNPVTGQMAGFFDHVCSPPDLEDYPEDAPLPGARPPWFRLDYVDILVRSREEATAFVEDVRHDVDRLVKALDDADKLIPGGLITIGADCLEGSSEAV